MVDTWNKVASFYEEKFMNLNIYDHTYDFFCNSIQASNANILEMGCGPGNITKYILSRRSDFKVYGTDISRNMIELARKNNPAAKFDEIDCRQINSIERKFEGIICGFCIPYLSADETDTLITDSYKLLNDNGVFYLSFVEGNPANSGYRVGSTGDRIFFNVFNSDSIIYSLQKTKFEVLKKFNVDYKLSSSENETHTILIAGK